MTTRRAITAFLRFCLRVFYRRIELVGLERVPAGASIFAVNHPNGLVDPLFLLCFAPRPVSFLGKAPLFRYPLIGWIARTFDSIPVYRKQDNTTGSNRETFGRSREVLQRGGSIAIFPEGTTHSDPQLRELKTGVARIALGATLEALGIVPTGIYYKAKHVFRSSALVVFGEPIRVEPENVDASGEPPADAVARLTAAIDEALDAVTLQADSHDALELIGQAEDIFTADEDQPLAEELALRRRFIEGYHFLRQRDPARLQQLATRIDRFESELRRLKIAAHELTPRVTWRDAVPPLLLLTFAINGAIVSYPTYRLVGVLAKRFSKGEGALIATMKVLAALALYPLTYIGAAMLIGWRFGTAWGLAAAIAFPLLGYLALRVFVQLDDLRVTTFHTIRPASRLAEERERIREEIAAVAREM